LSKTQLANENRIYREQLLAQWGEYLISSIIDHWVLAKNWHKYRSATVSVKVSLKVSLKVSVQVSVKVF